MVKDHKNLSLVKAICHMSNIFDRDIIAEGVEYKEQAELLQQSGCNNIQGFGVAKPMPVEAFLAWQPDRLFE
jgi:EAL domain-containing protein (putative c-di-GMP-specific phosphodiesterase class I)